MKDDGGRGEMVKRGGKTVVGHNNGEMHLVTDHGVINLNELPGRKRGKQEILARLPELNEIKDQIKKGLGVGEAAYLKLDSSKVASLNITTSRRIIKDLLKGFIEAEELTTKDGRPLDVYNYRADDGSEVVYVADAVELTRTQLPKRVKGGKRQAEK
jgi:hypothetical protein